MLQPLHCTSCNAPLAVGTADTVECPHCHTPNTVPDDVKALRSSAAADTEARDRAAKIIDALGHPPSAIARFLVRSLGVLVIIAAVLIVIPVVLVVGTISSSWMPFGMQLYDVLSAKQQVALGVVSPAVFLVVVCCSSAQRAITRSHSASSRPRSPRSRPHAKAVPRNVACAARLSSTARLTSARAACTAAPRICCACHRRGSRA